MSSSRMLPFFCGSVWYTRRIMANFPRRGHTHQFIIDLSDITEKFGQNFGYYMQKNFGKDFGRTTKKFGLKF